MFASKAPRRTIEVMIQLRKASLLLIVLIPTFVSFYVGYSFTKNEMVNASIPVRSKANPYPLISPLLAYETPESGLQGKYKELKGELQKYIDINKDSGKISVYFRDLGKGQWIGVNQENEYSPASLLKVLIMIAYFRQAENDPTILKARFLYTDELKRLIDTTAFAETTKLIPGNYYDVDSLIKLMIVDSDNGAKDLLYKHIDNQALTEFYAALGLSGENKNSQYTISPKTYAYFFRLLYNATFLNAEYSNQALTILSEATFDEGLVAGVPKEITVAHKFGERIEAGKNITTVELHDCGIIYAPQKPYLLCVMTQSGSLEKNKKTISEISKITYDIFVR